MREEFTFLFICLNMPDYLPAFFIIYGFFRMLLCLYYCFLHATLSGYYSHHFHLSVVYATITFCAGCFRYALRPRSSITPPAFYAAMRGDGVMTLNGFSANGVVDADAWSNIGHEYCLSACRARARV